MSQIPSFGSMYSDRIISVSLTYSLRREGIADAELARREGDRNLKRKADDDGDFKSSRKRSRSISSYSSSSVSTISTNLSRSSSPRRASETHTGQSQMLSGLYVNRKMRRSRSASIPSTESSHEDNRRKHAQDFSNYDHKGRGRSVRGADRTNRHRPNLRSVPYASDSSSDNKRKRQPQEVNRSKRRRRASRSPIDRGRDRDVFGKRATRRTWSRSESRDRSEVVRNRKSITPRVARIDDGLILPNHRPPIDHGDNYSRDNDRYGRSARFRDENIKGGWQQSDVHARNSRIQRSLSPFSKRLALTQVMNMER